MVFYIEKATAGSKYKEFTLEDAFLDLLWPFLRKSRIPSHAAIWWWGDHSRSQRQAFAEFLLSVASELKEAIPFGPEDTTWKNSKSAQTHQQLWKSPGIASALCTDQFMNPQQIAMNLA